MEVTATKDQIVASFRTQAEWGARLGSPFMARLMTLTADAIERGDEPTGLIGDWPGNPGADGLALRFAGAVHALVLAGADPALAVVYPPHPLSENLWPAVAAAMAARPDHFRSFLALSPQTNEVRRSALLLPGFIEIARRSGRKLRLLEIGASAGLNLIWDRYRYSYGEGRTWGDPASPVEISCEWHGAPFDFNQPVEIAGRAACDFAPIDLADPAQRHRLRAYLWPDQPDRLARLDAAAALALRLGFKVERADAGEWLDRQLMRAADANTTTVLYHSVVWQYLPQTTRDRIRGRMADFGKTRPLAWLALEIARPDSAYELRLRWWPGDGSQTGEKLAEASPHGAWLKWDGK